MRKLASIQEIQSIDPIPGKDRIELAHVLGWTVIVQKGEYKPGDQTVYVEIDSIMPERPEFEFLRPKGFRIKTMKINGKTDDGQKVPVISQGICFPLTILPGDANIDTELNKDLLVGTDVTEFIGVKKYDEYGDALLVGDEVPDKNSLIKDFMFRHRVTRPIAKVLFTKSGAKNSTAFPSIVEKTDETRIQAMPNLLEKKELSFVGREKIDGQSGTFILRKVPSVFSFIRPKYKFIVCSRNKRIPVQDSSSYWFVANKYNMKDVLKNLIGSHDWICIQGEVVGPRIQGNKYNLSECDLYCFNLINSDDGMIPCKYAEDEVGNYGLKWAPLVVSDYHMPSSVEEILSYANGKSALCNTLREGIVFRNYDAGISFKAVSPEFLLKNDA